MGKGGAVLGIIGIIVGAGGFGFGVLAWNSATSNNTKLTELENDLINQVNSTLNLFNTTLIGLTSEDNWYNYRDSEFTPSPAVVYLPIPNMSIIFELTLPRSLHLLFTCSARCLGNPASFSDLFFYFMINDVRQTEMPWTRVGSYESNTNYEYYSVSLQHYIEIMPPGVYNITVVVLTEQVGNFIRESSLFIQTFII
ncbi:MAG: hypothetical protein ACW98X_01835 [Promethearchaeota archaeon]|jgi:hypothetical protein